MKFLGPFIFSSANAFNLEQSKNLSFGEELNKNLGMCLQMKITLDTL